MKKTSKKHFWAQKQIILKAIRLATRNNWSKGMYLVAKQKNEDHVSCLAHSHLVYGGRLGIFLSPRAHIERESWFSS